MKTYIILSVLTFSYVCAAPDAPSTSISSTLDVDECDGLAMNIEDNPDRQGIDSLNQDFSIPDFLKLTKMDYYVARATPNVVPIDDKFCHVPFHGRHCGPVHFYQKFYQNYHYESLTDGLRGIRLEMNFIATNLETGNAMRYKMHVVGDNSDDYIFKWVEGTKIIAHEIDKDGNIVKEITDIPQEVLNRLTSRFAINQLGPKPEEYDLDFSSKVQAEHTEGDADKDTREDKGKSTAEDRGKRKLGDEEEDVAEEIKDRKEVHERNFDEIPTYMVIVTCDGKSLWGGYHKLLVDADKEVKPATDLDRVIDQVLSHTNTICKLHDNTADVKPISTYMPERFAKLVPIPMHEEIPVA